jgi:hypothetical protein
VKLAVFYDIADGGSLGIYFSNGLGIKLGDRVFMVALPFAIAYLI